MSAEAAPITDADRLAKLWEAYRVQEEEFQEALARLERLSREMENHGIAVQERERALADKDAEIARLHDVIAQKDARITELQQLEEDAKAIGAYQQRIRELETAYAQEKERLAKLFLLYEEAVKNAAPSAGER